MDYTNLLNDSSGKKSKVGIIGATRGYGYTLLAQIPRVKHMDLSDLLQASGRMHGSAKRDRIR